MNPGFRRVGISRCSGSTGFIAGFIVVPPAFWFVVHAGFGWRKILRNGDIAAHRRTAPPNWFGRDASLIGKHVRNGSPSESDRAARSGAAGARGAFCLSDAMGPPESY